MKEIEKLLEEIEGLKKRVEELRAKEQEKERPKQWRVSEDNNIFCGNMRVGRCLSVFDAALIVGEHNRAMQEVTR
jgi:hypothetical protein